MRRKKLVGSQNFNRICGQRVKFVRVEDMLQLWKSQIADRPIDAIGLKFRQAWVRPIIVISGPFPFVTSSVRFASTRRWFTHYLNEHVSFSKIHALCNRDIWETVTCPSCVNPIPVYNAIPNPEIQFVLGQSKKKRSTKQRKKEFKIQEISFTLQKRKGYKLDQSGLKQDKIKYKQNIKSGNTSSFRSFLYKFHFHFKK